MDNLTVIEKYEGNENAFITALIETKGESLPSKIEDLIKIFEFTDLKAKAWKIIVNKMSKLGEQAALYKSALRSGQQWSIASLYAQKRLGEITINLEKAQGKKPEHKSLFHTRTKTEQLEEMGISRHEVYAAERLAESPETLESVIESAKKNNEIPTARMVLNTINVQINNFFKEGAEERKNKKIVNEADTAIKEYYDTVKEYRDKIKFAIINAEAGKFAPEGKNFMIKKHNEIKKLMNELEEKIQK